MNPLLALSSAVVTVLFLFTGCCANCPWNTAAYDASKTTTEPAAAGPFLLPPLPYAKDALRPYINPETVSFHYEKHHAGYVAMLNKLTAGKPEAGKNLEEVVATSEGPLFNNAAQIWNHTFYWNSMKPGGGGAPAGALAEAIKKDFGSFAEFKRAFTESAVSQFGSGWAWLVLEKGQLKIVHTSNADLPLKHDQAALLTIDVWEHAYYLDYRNVRAKYVEAFMEHLANWDFASANYERVMKTGEELNTWRPDQKEERKYASR